MNSNAEEHTASARRHLTRDSSARRRPCPKLFPQRRRAKRYHVCVDQPPTHNRPSGAQPPEATGGAGYGFESAVGAWYLLHLLIQRCPFDSDLGPPRTVKFQVAVDGWPLDDVLLELAGPENARAMVSVKRNPADGLTSRGFSRDFAEACWHAARQEGPPLFSPAVDLAVLATRPPSRNVQDALTGLVRRAKGSPHDLWARHTTPRWLNATQRTLLQSFAAGASEDNAGMTGSEVGCTLRCVRLDVFDFGDPASRSESQAVYWLSQVGVGSDNDGARRVWTALCTTATALRETSGSVSQHDLLRAVRSRVDSEVARNLARISADPQSQRSIRLPSGPSEDTMLHDSEVV